MRTLARLGCGIAGTVLAVILAGAAAVAAFFGALPSLLAGAGRASAGAAASAEADADIPPAYLALYQQAAAICPGLPWTVLAAIGKVESDHGRSTLPGVRSGTNHAGAMGPMQFIGSTWAIYHPPGPAGQEASPYDPADAIPAAARYLCDSGAQGSGKDLRKAIFAYNHADWYVDKVLAQADRYSGPPAPLGSPPVAGGGSDAVARAIAFARAAIGIPYVWGGDGPAEGGYDCSGLTKAAYATAGITLQRVAEDQYRTTPRVPAGAPILPGDLVFFGIPGNIHHVGLAIGDGLMIEAPRTGVPVRIGPILYPGNDFYGATRPAAARNAS